MRKVAKSEIIRIKPAGLTILMVEVWVRLELAQSVVTLAINVLNYLQLGIAGYFPIKSHLHVAYCGLCYPHLNPN